VEWYQPATRYCGTCKAFDFSAVASQGQTKVGEQCVQGQEEKQDSQRDVQTLGGTGMIEVLKLALKALNAGEHAHLIMNTDGIKDKVRQAIAELESQEPFGYFRYDIRLDAWVQSRDSNQGAAFYTHPPQRTEKEPVQVSPLEFVEMVMEKEHLIGKPIFWAEWPNKEKNNA
jgi:hypothetical protein